MRPHILWIKVGFIGAGIHALVVEEGLLGDLIAKKTMLTPNDSEISSLDFRAMQMEHWVEGMLVS